MGGVYSSEGIKNVVKYASMIAGSKESLLENSFLSVHYLYYESHGNGQGLYRLMITAIESGLP